MRDACGNHLESLDDSWPTLGSYPTTTTTIAAAPATVAAAELASGGTDSRSSNHCWLVYDSSTPVFTIRTRGAVVQNCRQQRISTVPFHSWTVRLLWGGYNDSSAIRQVDQTWLKSRCNCNLVVLGYNIYASDCNCNWVSVIAVFSY